MAEQAEAVLTMPESQAEDEAQELTVGELIEDVSIDGMCGVY